MNKFSSLAAGLFLLAACNNPAESTSATASAGTDTTAAGKMSTADSSSAWQTLFNGKTKDGWHSYGKSIAMPSIFCFAVEQKMDGIAMVNQ